MSSLALRLTAARIQFPRGRCLLGLSPRYCKASSRSCSRRRPPWAAWRPLLPRRGGSRASRRSGTGRRPSSASSSQILCSRNRPTLRQKRATLPQAARGAATIAGATCRPGCSASWRSLALWLWVPTLRLSDLCGHEPRVAQPCGTTAIGCFLGASTRVLLRDPSQT